MEEPENPSWKEGLPKNFFTKTSEKTSTSSHDEQEDPDCFARFAKEEITDEQIEHPLNHLNTVMGTFSKKELDLTWQLTKSVTISITLPLLVGIIATQLSLQSWGKFFLELLMTYTIIEANQWLETIFSSARNGKPVETVKILTPTGSDMMYLWICFILVRYVLLGPVVNLLSFGI